MKPLRLTDAELDAVFAAARPIAVNRRDDFLQAVAASLRRCEVIGPGVVHRICAEVQREHFDPPVLERNVGLSRWDRDEPRFEKISKRVG
jgi:hypothetical protein